MVEVISQTNDSYFMKRLKIIVVKYYFISNIYIYPNISRHYLHIIHTFI